MNQSVDRYDGPVGGGISRSNPSANVGFKYYLADRPGATRRIRAAELALDITIDLPHPVRTVWPIFKDFNLWMNRFGFKWDKVPAEGEDTYVYCGNKAGANPLGYGLDDARSKYVVRKVIPERLVYFDSLPSPLLNKDGVWMGHNLMTLYDEGGRTRVEIFMEHTWYSETMTIEELRGEAKYILDSGIAFWRDYFIADLMSAVEARASTPL
jgi:hypothetical protein